MIEVSVCLYNKRKASDDWQIDYMYVCISRKQDS